MRLLLDTCTFLWYASAHPALSVRIRDTLGAAENTVFLSVVSNWEIAVKHRLGRLPLPQAPGEYVPRVRERHGFEALPLGEAAVTHLDRLPPLHRDPFDRMLVCLSIEHDLTLVTPDPVLAAYPVKRLWFD